MNGYTKFEPIFMEFKKRLVEWLRVIHFGWPTYPTFDQVDGDAVYHKGNHAEGFNYTICRLK